MAWAYQDSGAVAFGSAIEGTSVAYPATVNAGDLLLLWVIADSTSSRFANAPSGFTSIWYGNYRALWGRVADGNETGTVTVTPSVTIGATSIHGMARFTGGPDSLVDYTPIASATLGRSTEIGTNAIKFPALSGVAAAAINGALIFGFGGLRSSGGAAIVSVGSPFLEAQEGLKADGTTFSVASIYNIQTTAADVSAVDVTLDRAAADLINSAVMIALEPGAEEPVNEPTVQTEPLYYGANLLANKTAIEYSITAGHTDIGGTLLVKGTDGTTNGTGNFILPGNPALGNVDDPVTLHLYWEEGSDPVVDRSIIVKTTLVAI